MINCDSHLHSHYSADSREDLKNIAETALSMGLEIITLTDHYDPDFPKEYGLDFSFNIDEYYKELKDLRSEYEGRIDIRCGIELGLMPHLNETIENITHKADFDLVIGSTHIVNGQDPYYDVFWKDRNPKEAYEDYYKAIEASIDNISDYDVYGHIDYIARYGPEGTYDYKDYTDMIDIILKKLISADKGIELNTAGLRSRLKDTNPSFDVLKRYRELGGDIITVGSDAHTAEHIGSGMDIAKEYLDMAGFKYYTVFKNRTPEFYMVKY